MATLWKHFVSVNSLNGIATYDNKNIYLLEKN